MYVGRFFPEVIMILKAMGTIGVQSNAGGVIITYNHYSGSNMLIGQWLGKQLAIDPELQDCTARLQLLHVIVTSHLRAREAKCGFPVGHYEIVKRYLVQHLSPESCRTPRHALYSTLCALPSTRSGSSCYGFSDFLVSSCKVHPTLYRTYAEPSFEVVSHYF